MNSIIRKRYGKTFKVKVAIETIKGEKTLQELGQQLAVHPDIIILYKRLFIEQTLQLYNRDRFQASHEYLTPNQMYINKFQLIEI